MAYNPKIHHRRSIRLKGYDYSQAGLYFITICCQDRACLFGDVIDGHMQCNDAGIMVNKWYDELESKFPDIRCHEIIVMPKHFHCILENVGNVGLVGADLRVCPNIHTSPIADERISGERISGERISDERFSDERISDERISDERFSDERFSDERISDERISDERFSDERFSDERFSDERFSDERFSDERFSGERFSDERFSGEPDAGEPIEGEHIGSPLHRVVQWFKTMTTNEYIRGVKSLGWQRFNGKLWQRNYYEHIIRNDQSYQRISAYIINNPAKWKEDKFNK